MNRKDTYKVAPKVKVRLNSYETEISQSNVAADGPESWAKGKAKKQIREMSDKELADLVRRGTIEVDCYKKRS